MSIDSIEEDPVEAFWQRAEWLAMGADSQGGPDLSGQKEYIALWEDFYQWAQTEGADHSDVPITIEIYKDKIESLKEKLRYHFLNEVNSVLLALIDWRIGEIKIETMVYTSKTLKLLPPERRAKIEARDNPGPIYEKLVAKTDQHEIDWKTRAATMEENWGDIFWTKKMARRLQDILDGDPDDLPNAQNLWAMENFAEIAEISERLKESGGNKGDAD